MTKKNIRKIFILYGIGLLLTSIVLTPFTSCFVFGDTMDSGVESVMASLEEEEQTEQSTSFTEEVISEPEINESVEKVLIEETSESSSEVVEEIDKTEELKELEKTEKLAPQIGAVQVSNWKEFKEAFQNDAVTAITLLNDISNENNSLSQRTNDLAINGAGHTLGLGSGSPGLPLGNLEGKQATLTINNLQFKKILGGAIIGATGTGTGWTVNLNQVSDIIENPAKPNQTGPTQLVVLPEGIVNFTGGTNTFLEKKSLKEGAKLPPFIEAKETTIRGKQTKVEVVDTQNYIFLTSNQEDARFEISDGAQFIIDKGKNGGSLNSNTIILSGKGAQILIESGTFIANVGKESNVFRLTGDQSQIQIHQSQVHLSGSGFSSFLIYMRGANNKIVVDQNTNLRFDHYSGAAIDMAGPNNSIEMEQSKVTVTIKERGNGSMPSKNAISMVGKNASFSVGNQSTFHLTSGVYNAIDLISILGENARFEVSDVVDFSLTNNSNYLINVVNVSGANAVMEIINTPSFKIINNHKNTNSILVTGEHQSIEGSASLNINHSKVDILGESQSGITVSSAVDAALLNLSNKAIVSVNSTGKGGVTVCSSDTSDEGEIRVTEQSELHTFELHIGVRLFNITDKGLVKTNKLRSEQSGSQIIVEKKGYLDVHSLDQSEAVLLKPSTGMGQEYSIIVKDPGSQMNVTSKGGPAIVFSSLTGKIIIENFASFTVKGKVANQGIIQGGNLNNEFVLDGSFDQPLALDLRNENTNGMVFSTNSRTNEESHLIGRNSKLSLWKQKSPQDTEATHVIADSKYEFTGPDLNQLKTGTIDPKNVTDGLAGFSRIVSDNSIMALADELYVPTNADRKIYGHFSVFSKDDELLRDAKPGEITGVITVKRKGKEIVNQKITSTNNVAYYGENSRNGMFELTLDTLLEADDTIEMTEVKIEEGNGYIEVPTIKVFDIQPPEPAKFENATVHKANNQLHGTGEKGSIVTANVTNQENQNFRQLIPTTVDDTGKFSLSLSEANLQKDDKIQVFLSDQAGSASKAGVRDWPKTNNEVGNRNPEKELAYHDTIFASATVLIVIDGPTGTLQFKAADEWDFGTQKISTQEAVYSSKNTPILSFEDLRSFEKKDQWSLSVSQKGAFETVTGDTLRNVGLSFKDAKLTGDTWDQTETIEVELDAQQISNQSVEIIDSQRLNNQRGSFTIDFNQAELVIPESTSPKAAHYTTTLEWSFQNVP